MINNIFKRIVTSLFLIILLLSSLYFNDFTWKTLVIIFIVLCLYEFYNLFKKIFKSKFLFTILFFLIVIYLSIFYFLLIKIKIQFGEDTILILLITCIFSDIGGYIFGKIIGGPKLTSISPKKTISGAFGSIILTLIGTSLFIVFLNKIHINNILFELSYLFYVWLFIMSVYCQIGDLIISFLKRKAKIKDTGKILPGHGGILDRVDGILFAIPFGVLTYSLLIIV